MRAKFLIAVLGLGVLATSALANPNRWSREWPSTDFETTSIENWSEIMSGGPPKDGIPALSDPGFIGVGDETRIGPREAV